MERGSPRRGPPLPSLAEREELPSRPSIHPPKRRTSSQIQKPKVGGGLCSHKSIGPLSNWMPSPHRQQRQSCFSCENKRVELHVEKNGTSIYFNHICLHDINTANRSWTYCFCTCLPCYWSSLAIFMPGNPYQCVGVSPAIGKSILQ